MTFNEWLETIYPHGIGPNVAELKRVWDAATAAERERCAKLSEELSDTYIANAIRKGKYEGLARN